VSKVGRFDRWPMVLIDLQTEERIVVQTAGMNTCAKPIRFPRQLGLV
jgi:hypothetical protein